MKSIFRIGIVILLCFCFGNIFVYADSCDTQDIARLRTLASYIEATYDYIENEDLYSVTVTGITEELYVLEKNSNTEYRGTDYVNGTATFKIVSGGLTLEVYSVSCDTRSLKTITLDLPKFNVFSKEENCEKFASYNLDFCDPWYQGELDHEIFIEKMEPYLWEAYQEENNSSFDLLSYVKQYFLFILLGIVLFVIMIILLIVYRRKRGVLE